MHLLRAGSNSQMEMNTQMRRLQLLLVIDSLGSGGAQRQMVSLAIGLSQRGHRVELFNYYPKLNHFRSEVESAKIEIHDLPKKGRYDLGPAFEIRKIVSSRSIDAVISFLDTPNLYSILGTIGKSQTKLLVSERSMFMDNHLDMKTLCTYQGFRFADAITVNSFHQCDRILRKFPWSERKLYVIWNGVDLTKYRPAAEVRTDARKPLEVLGVGTIVANKNVYNLVRALNSAREHGADVVVDWYGKLAAAGNSQGDFDRCANLVRRCGLEKLWRWRGECSGMHEIYPKYDVLIHPSFSEGLPNAVCEGLACGLPVLASSVGDLPRLVTEGLNGWLFDPNSTEEMAEALIRAWKARTEWDAMSHASRRVAEEQLGLDRLVDDYEETLYGICPTR